MTDLALLKELPTLEDVLQGSRIDEVIARGDDEEVGPGWLRLVLSNGYVVEIPFDGGAVIIHPMEQ